MFMVRGSLGQIVKRSFFGHECTPRFTTREEPTLAKVRMDLKL